MERLPVPERHQPVSTLRTSSGPAGRCPGLRDAFGRKRILCLRPTQPKRPGKLILNLKSLWAEANMEERREMLLSMLDAVYFDSKTSKALVAVRPRTPFKPVFQVAVAREGSRIRIVNEPLSGLVCVCGGGGGEPTYP